MKINRNKFAQHLERLACSGQCTEAVFNDAFAATALTPDALLLVDIPALEDAESLEQEVGIANLDLLIKASRLLLGEGNTSIEVDVYVKDGRLVIDDGTRGVQRLLTAAPKTIATRIDGDVANKLFAAVPEGTDVPLSRSTLEGVVAAFSLYKAEEIEVQINKIGGKILVGTEKTDRAEFDLDVTSEEAYTLLFGKHLVDVFSIVTDFSSAAIQLGGPKKPILVKDGFYSYMLSPRVRSADETKPALKKEKAAKAEKEEIPAETAKPKNRGRRAATAGK